MASPNKNRLFSGPDAVRTNLGFLRPDGQSEQILTLGAHACCSPNIFGEIFEISSVHKSQMFGNFHQALPPIFRGPLTHSTVYYFEICSIYIARSHIRVYKQDISRMS